MKQPEKNSSVFYGTWVLAAIWLVYFFTTTPISYGTSVISTKIVLEYGWNEGIIGLASSMNYLLIVLTSIPGGVLEQKKGYRFTIILGAAVGTLAFLFLSLFYSDPVLYVAMFGAAGICAALCGLTSGPSLINEWYARNKALPMAILMTAGSVGGFLMPLVAQAVSDVSIQACFLLYMGMVGSCILLALFVIRDHPQDVGEIRDGRRWTAAHPVKETASTQTNSRSKTPSECCRSRTFLLFSLQLITSRAIGIGINSYVVLYAIQNGVSPMRAAFLLTVYNIFNCFGRLLSGFSDRLPVSTRSLNLICFFLQAAGAVLLSLVPGFVPFAVSCAIAGFGFGIYCTLWPLLIVSLFGSENFTVLNGTCNTVGCIGSAASPTVVYLIASALGGYSVAFLTLGLLGLLCIITVPAMK
ncbi:MAG: MFS transporter [Lachnospiraceae bacterium]|nr:MFS transporter [Lachnospiraceae bacterium]